MQLLDSPGPLVGDCGAHRFYSFRVQGLGTLNPKLALNVPSYSHFFKDS